MQSLRDDIALNIFGMWPSCGTWSNIDGWAVKKDTIPIVIVSSISAWTEKTRNLKLMVLTLFADATTNWTFDLTFGLCKSTDHWTEHQFSSISFYLKVARLQVLFKTRFTLLLLFPFKFQYIFAFRSFHMDLTLTLSLEWLEEEDYLQFSSTQIGPIPVL